VEFIAGLWIGIDTDAMQYAIDPNLDAARSPGTGDMMETPRIIRWERSTFTAA
jgi:hypothetical protein